MNKYKQNNNILNKLQESNICFWLDSSGGPKELCNLSMCGSNPKYYLYGYLNEVNLIDNESGAITYSNENIFDFLEEKIKEESTNKDGVFVGYLTYDLFQRKPDNNKEYKNYPDFFFAYFDTIHNDVLNNNKESTSFATNTSKNETISPILSNMTDEEYLQKVLLIKEEIKAGNIYQANLTREYYLEKKVINDLELYIKLRNTSPNPFGCYFKTPFLTILSSSPEEFLYVANCHSEPKAKNLKTIGDSSVASLLQNDSERYIRTRPIKGTLSKGSFDIDSKNKAENLMIVDLERNDFGRICEFGSIQVKDILKIESYENLNHVVSTIEGKLKTNTSLKQIFEAVFPGGSITGAPKIAAMKMIDSIEPTKRGAYTGAFGYIKTNGTMNFNVLIRTIFIENGKLSFNVGGGIVADSNPEDELEETRLKAKGIVDTLQ